jgi:sterol desaturase/sphingolipid hydroxylase (fatty acid hydroxylase superfamily)
MMISGERERRMTSLPAPIAGTRSLGGDCTENTSHPAERSEAPDARARAGRTDARVTRGLPAGECPPERNGSVLVGVFAHLGPPVSCIVAWAIFGVTPLTVVLTFVGVWIPFVTFILAAEKTRAAVALPRYTARRFVGGMAVIFLKGVVGGGTVVTVGWWLLSFVPPHEGFHNGWGRIVVATFLTDLGYYGCHRLLSHGRGNDRVLKYYRKKHAAHHGVAELDFLRGNESSFVDTAISQFQPSLIVASYVLGMDLASTWAAYALILTLQATDHSSVTYNIGWLRYIFMDNHAHKLHHCRGGTSINHAAAFSIYDRLWGTYHEDWTINPSHLHRHRMAIPVSRSDAAPRGRRGRPRGALAERRLNAMGA